MKDLDFSLVPNDRLLTHIDSELRSTRKGKEPTDRGMSLGLRVDRWALLIVTAVLLGCRYFDQLSHVLGIAPSVLSKRIADMQDSDLLRSETDRQDSRRKIYRLTPSSRHLFGYLVCLSTWASVSHFHERTSIRPKHRGCGKAFIPRVVCNHCHQAVNPWDVEFSIATAL